MKPSSLPLRSASADFTADRRILLLCALAVPVGAAGAGLAKALLWLIAAVTDLSFFGRLSTEALSPETTRIGPWIIAVPVVGGLIVGLMARYGSRKIRGHGIPEALEAVLLGKSIIDPKVAVLKPLSSAVAIGTGGPFGAEGPIIMTGGAFGSVFAQLFHLSSAERKTLLVAGAAAGMSAVFSTPVAAVLLAVELLLFELKPRSLVPVSVASAVAFALRVPLLGAGPMLAVAGHGAPGGVALGMAAAAGLLTGLAGAGLSAFVYLCEDLFSKLPIHWMWWPALGGLVVGAGGLLDPRVLGVGYGTIHLIMLGRLLGASLLGLVILKALVWAVALGSGTSGGVLAPLLMIGGGIGALFGSWVGASDPGLWAMTGMAAMMAGAMGAPLTGLTFVLELTGDLRSLPLLLVAAAASYCVTALVQRRSILTEKLARRGQHVAREYAVDPLERFQVAELMDPHPPLIAASTTLGEFSRRLSEGDPEVCRRQAVIAADPLGRVVGVVSREDIAAAIVSGRPLGTALADLAPRETPVAHPDETLRGAVARMLEAGSARMPVVDPDTGAVVGYLGRAEILSAQERLRGEEEFRERVPLLKPRVKRGHKGADSPCPAAPLP